MLIKLALIISVLLQFAAAVIAITLIRRTRTNIAWWLISAAFLLMAVRRTLELYNFRSDIITTSGDHIRSWIGVAISVLMLGSLIFIRRIFDIQREYDNLRKEHEAKVLQAIIHTEERERRRFAKELHDGLGPILSSIKMSFSAIARNTDSNSELVKNTSNMIDESVASLKEISGNLSPHILENFGLNNAVNHFIQNTRKPSGLSISYTSQTSRGELTKNTELTIYRIISELIHNAIKHSHANTVSVDLNKEEDHYLLEYFDDGIGFDEALWETSPGMGLKNITSRVKALNGELHFDSTPQNEIYITIKFYNTEK